MTPMTTSIVQATLTPEGRATVPAAARAALGVGSGDRIVFIIEDGLVRLVSARQLVEQVWANNTGGDAGDSVRDVQQERALDQHTEQARWARIAAASEAARETDEEATSRLLAQLGLIS